MQFHFNLLIYTNHNNIIIIIVTILIITFDYKKLIILHMQALIENLQ